MSIYNKNFLALFIAILICMIAVACGGGSSSTTPQSATAPPTSTPPTTPPDNPFLLILPGDSTPGNPIITDARTIAVAGVGASATLQVFLDGSVMGTLTAPNQFGAFNEPLYLFQETFPPGTHSVKAIATYIDGTTAQATGTFVAGPLLTLTSPVGDNAIVSGTLAVQGTFSPSGTTTLTATLGSLPSMSTHTSPFSLTFDLSGLAAGTYTLTVQATTSNPAATTVIQRTLMVLVNPAFTYTRVATSSVSVDLLAAENNLVVYQSPDGSVRVQDTNTSSEVVLAGAASLQHLNYWTINNGHVFAAAVGADSPIGSNNQPQYQIYEWDPDGSRHNLSQLAGANFDFQSDPVAHWPWVIWGHENATDVCCGEDLSSASYTLLNLETGTSQLIAPPPGISYVITNNYDFLVNGNTVDFYFLSITFPAGSSNFTSDIFHWNSDSQQYVKITNGGAQNSPPQTDGTLLAWQTGPLPAHALVVAPIATPGAQTVLSTNADGFQLKDGLLAWIEGNESTLPGQPSGPFTVKVFDGQTVTTLGTAASAFLPASGGGAIVYQIGTSEDQSTTFLWTPTQSSRTLLPGETHTSILSGQFLYFTIDWSQPLYRVTWR